MRVALADADQVLREGLESIIACVDGIDIVGSYADGESLLRAIASTVPDVVVMEAHLPDGPGAEWVAHIKREEPRIKVLILTSSHADSDLLLSLEAGVDGYVSKEGSADDLLRAIHEACDEHFYVSPVAARQMRDLTTSTGGGSLSPREIEVLLASQEGLTTEEIGIKLLLSSSTIKTHLSNAYRKLGARNRVEAVHEAVRRGIITQ